MRRTARRTALMAAASAVALAPIAASAQQARAQGQAAPARRTVQSWSFDLRTTYTDNFRRLPDELTRRVTGDQEVTLFPGLPPVIARVPLGTDVIEIDPPDNVVVTAALSGATVFERPGLTGVVSGSVSVNANADDSSIDDRLRGTLDDTPLAPDIAAAIRDGDEPDRSFGFTDAQDVFVQPNIIASGSVRVVDDLFFVDASALAQQQALNRGADLAAESAGQLGDQTTYVGGSISPYLSRVIAGGATVEARYRVSSVVVAQEDFEAFGFGLERPEDQRFGNDSFSQEALAELRSGDLLDRVEFAVTASARRSEEDGSDVLPQVDLDRLSAALDVEYEINRSFGLTGAVGYDEVSVEQRSPGGTSLTDDDERSDALSGVFWSAGFTYTPSPRTLASLSVGERFGGTLIEGQLRYRPTPRLSFDGRAARELGTGVEGTFGAFQALNSQTLSVIESLGRLQADSRSRLLDRAVALRGATGRAGIVQGGLSVRNNYSLGASFDAGRTNLTGSVSFDESEFDGFGGGVRTNETTSLNLSARRQVSRRVSLTGRTRVLRLDGAFPEDIVLAGDDVEAAAIDGQSSTQVFAAIDAAYQVGPRFSATAQVYHSRRESDGQPFGGTGFDFKENAASVGIRWTF